MFTNGTLMLSIIRFRFVHVFFLVFFNVQHILMYELSVIIIIWFPGLRDAAMQRFVSIHVSTASLSIRDSWVKVLRNIMGCVLDLGTWVWFSCTFLFCILTFLPIPFHGVTIHAKSVAEPSSPSHKPLAHCHWCHSNELLVHVFSLRC